MKSTSDCLVCSERTTSSDDSVDLPAGNEPTALFRIAASVSALSRQHIAQTRLTPSFEASMP